MARASARRAVKRPSTIGIVMERILHAPRERVWRAWTDPEALMRWWGPKHFTAPVIRQDLRVGGRFDFAMRSPDGKDYWNTGAFRELVPNERLVAVVSFSDEKGDVVPATHYGLSADFPMEMLWTVTLEGLAGGMTRLTVREDGFPNEVEAANAKLGWESSLDKLAELLE
jgi:uncharacterized protein YndB with AHSA1/START domain